MTQPQQPGGNRYFVSADAITDNVALLEWCENTRRVIHAGALELGIVASEIDARLRAVNPGLVGGMSGRARARQVARPIQQASESLVIASRYIVTAATRFQAVYLPELEAAGHKPRRNDFRFKA
ncbi:hypothetical protein E1091_15920 [Micromonospora fluostatini]|uniref:Uncharacterized protein n=1 Tax=Micromonospora fluostatini TaxID=1629071 RepID=A0ABY2DEG6_9ACTN|nr:hypothetical protein E1091_15920 [Micromonospora fluostatini]